MPRTTGPLFEEVRLYIEEALVTSPSSVQLVGSRPRSIHCLLTPSFLDDVKPTCRATPRHRWTSSGRGCYRPRSFAGHRSDTSSKSSSLVPSKSLSRPAGHIASKGGDRDLKSRIQGLRRTPVASPASPRAGAGEGGRSHQVGCLVLRCDPDRRACQQADGEDGDGGGPDSPHGQPPFPPWCIRGRTSPPLSVGPAQGVRVAAVSSGSGGQVCAN